MYLQRDWDYFASMLESLRYYAHRHGTIPQWNFFLCAGKPELANPQSWAFTWPSLIAYALPPYPALFVLISVLTVAGGIGFYFWSRRWVPNRAACATASVLFAMNGYFGTRINQGHVTFLFFHLVPWMLWLSDRVIDDKGEGRDQKNWLLLSLLSFLFFTSGLPHALFYAYPLYVLYVGCRIHRERRISSAWLTPTRTVLFAHFSGLLLASYKLWPVIGWQLKYPRTGLQNENNGIGDILGNFLHYQSYNFPMRDVPLFPSQVWGNWEYQAFIGLVPFCFIALSLTVAAFDSWKHRAAPPFLVGLAAIAILVGLSLSLGNESPLSLTRIFSVLPGLSGVRVFARYQFLMLFGGCALVAYGLHYVSTTRSFRALKRRSIAAIAGVILCSSSAWQFVSLIWSVEIRTSAQAQKDTGVEPNAGNPRFLFSEIPQELSGWTWQLYLLRSNYWPATCYEPMTLPRIVFSTQNPQSFPKCPLAIPEPSQIDSITASSLTLRFPKDTPSAINLMVPILPGFSFIGAAGVSPEQQMLLKTTAETEPTLTIEASLPDNRWGLIGTVLGFLVVGGAWFQKGRATRHDTNKAQPPESESLPSRKHAGGRR